MTTMGYELKCDELNSLVSASSSVISAWKEALEDIRLRIEALTETEAMGGEAAEGIRNYLSEVHTGCMIPMIENMLDDYTGRLALYDYGYGQIDGDCHKHLHEDAIREAESRYHADGIRECEEESGKALGAVSDIVEIGNPSPDDIGNDCARIRFRLRNLLGDIDAHEVRTRNETEDLRALVSSVSGLVRSAMEQQSSGIAEYQPGDYIHLPGLQEAYMNTVSSIPTGAGTAKGSVQPWHMRKE